MSIVLINSSLLIVSCFYNIANSSERLELFFLSERLLSNKVLTFNDAIQFNIKSRSLGFEGITKNKKIDCLILDKFYLKNKKINEIKLNKYFYTVRKRSEFKKYSKENNLIFENI